MATEVINLEGITETYPGVFYIKKNKYVLVKDGEQYILTQDQIDRLAKSVMGHYEEMVRDFKPRKKRKPRQPRKPKAKVVGTIGGTTTGATEPKSDPTPKGSMVAYLEDPEKLVGVCRHDLQYILQCIDDELETIKERKKEIRKDTTRTDDQKILDKKECDKGLRLFKKLQKFAEPLVATAKRAPAKKKTTAKAPVKTRVKLTTAKPAQKTAPKKPSRRPRGKTKVNTLPI